ncbi:MAG: hypothetical protein U1D55_01475 [Phycisphaerae bacterium]
MSILAIDLGQSKSVFAFRDARQEEQVGSFNPNRQTIRKVLIRLAPKLVVVDVDSGPRSDRGGADALQGPDPGACCCVRTAV